MIRSIGELIEHRELLYMIAWRDIRVKYKQSVMGVLWALFMPLIVISAGFLVKYGMSLLTGKAMTTADIAGVSLKALPWAFFVSTIRASTNSLVGNGNLVTKIYFPRLVFPVAALFSQFFDFAIAACFLVVVLGFAKVGLSIYLLWTPLLLLILILFTAGAGILLSAANLFYRDVKYLVEVVLTFAIFATPVFYDVSLFGKWGRFLLFNPVAPILEALNTTVVLHQPPDAMWLLYSTLVSVFLVLIAVAVFRKLQWLFAERI